MQNIKRIENDKNDELKLTIPIELSWTKPNQATHAYMLTDYIWNIFVYLIETSKCPFFHTISKRFCGIQFMFQVLTCSCSLLLLLLLLLFYLFFFLSFRVIILQAIYHLKTYWSVCVSQIYACTPYLYVFMWLWNAGTWNLLTCTLKKKISFVECVYITITFNPMGSLSCVVT